MKATKRFIYMVSQKKDKDKSTVVNKQIEKSKHECISNKFKY